MKFRLFSLATLAVLLSTATLTAQTAATAPVQPRPRTSPHETIGLRHDGNRVTIVYGRPYSKAPRTGEIRKIWGELVPYGKVWRAGADEATLLITQQPLDLGGVTVPAGACTLYVLPAADGTAQLLLNKKIGQWGSDPYDEAQELARVPLTPGTLAEPVDQFTIALERNPDGGGWLRLKWENTQYSVPFAVKK
jgi:hypothetical protein